MRKLIKPNANEIGTIKTQKKKKSPPPYQTHSENYYYLKQSNNKTPIIVKMLDGEEIKGFIEWYDDKVIKIKRGKAPNLLIYKTAIKYIFKDEEKLKNDSKE
jgi:host factor-I protein